MRLKALRESRGFTQKVVALEIGISESNYARYERGVREPDIATLKQLSKFFSVSIDHIVCNDRSSQ